MLAETLEPLLREASAVAAGGLDGCFASIYEYAPGGALLELRSSAGWDIPADHSLSVGVEAHSVARAALRTGRPSVWTRLARSGPAPALKLWSQHGIRSAICVTIGANQPAAYGVLEVCTSDDVDFSDLDSSFLQLLANTLAMAVDTRRRREALEGQLAEKDRKLRVAEQALLAQRLLVQEGHHRIANSLQMLGSILDVQAKGAAAGDAREHIEAAARRVATIGVLHRRLGETGDGPDGDARDYLEGILHEMRALVSGVGDRALSLHMDRFMLPAGDLTAMGLIAGELVTNAIKYGHGTVTLRVRRQAGGLEISVSDDGGGFPPDFDPATSPGLGMRLVTGLARSLGGDVARVDRSVSYGRIVVTTGFGGV